MNSCEMCPTLSDSLTRVRLANARQCQVCGVPFEPYEQGKVCKLCWFRGIASVRDGLITQAELARQFGVFRSTVSQHVNILLGTGGKDNRVAHSRWNDRHRAQMNEASREWYANNKEHKSEYNKEYKRKKRERRIAEGI